ncbi:hypothetical protein [Microbacterium sp. PA5]|uniref:hypothetical protein n=1 Tax=Microbacterium sp. PA5 TaxID=3416654 RepID=UPI003CF71A57
MSFKVPESKASIDQNKWTFDLPTGESFTVPKMQYLNADIRERMTQIGVELKTVIDAGDKPSPEQTAALSAIQRELLETYAPGVYKLVSDDQVQAIFEGWQEASSITVGESSASAD